MKPQIERCPICGGELVTKVVTEVVRGGGHTAMLKAHASVCLHCGERLYTMDTVKWFDEIRAKLKRGETEDFEPIGQSFQVV